MTEVSIVFKTSLSDVYFGTTESNDRFDEWFKDQLSDAGVFNWVMNDNPQGIAGASALEVFVNDFDYRHLLEVYVVVDDGAHSFEEIYDNAPLLDYIEREVAPKALAELNELCSKITLPMIDGTFADMVFGEDNEFYALIHLYNNNYFVDPALREEQFFISDDFEVYV